jgi:diguanylate cyclase (GGDEF)-like protein
LSTLQETFADLGRSLREPADELLLEVASGGEQLLARLRVAICFLLLAMPVANYLLGGDRYGSLVGFVAVLLMLAVSLVWLNIARQPARANWLPMTSALFDVSAVSLVLLAMAIQSPSAGLNSVVVWSCYPLAILATVLRSRVRITLYAGLLAAVEFLLLAGWFLGTADAAPSSPGYGTASWSSVLQRTLLLMACTAIACVVVHRLQRLLQLAGTDVLTGLPNRLYLHHRMPPLLAAARAEGRAVCVALIDVDRLREINDELGHDLGDLALRHAIRTLAHSLGEDEPLVRMGGDEFVLLLPLPHGAAWERLEGLRRRVQAQPFEPEPGAEPRVITFSAGLACCPQDALDLAGLLRRADLRLHRAKVAGRNRVVCRDD